MKTIRTVVAVIVIGLLVVLTIHRSRNASRMYNPVILPLVSTKNGIHIDSDVSFQPDRLSILHEWYHLLSNAETDVLFCTYQWTAYKNDHPGILCPSIIYMGLAMKQWQTKHPGKSIKMSVMSNKDAFITDNPDSSGYLIAVGVWKAMGVEIGRVWNVAFKNWNQTRADNMHSKIIVVGDCTWVGSVNVQDAVHEGPVLWGESGCTVRSRHIASQSRNYFTKLYNHPSTGNVSITGITKYKKSMASPSFATHTSTCLPSEIQIPISKPFFNAKVTVAGSMPNRNIWNRDMDSNYIPLMNILRNAQRTVYIFMPNFNDITIWVILEQLMIYRDVKVCIITGKYYNTKNMIHEWVVRNAAAYRSNIHMIEKTILPSARKHLRVRRNLSIKWYGYNQVAFTSRKPRANHDKIILIDGEIVSIGSFNTTTISMLNASENVVIAESRTLVSHIWDTFGRIRWDHGEPLRLTQLRIKTKNRAIRTTKVTVI